MREAHRFTCHHELNWVEVFLTAEASGEIFAWVDRGLEFGTTGAEESVYSFNHLCWELEECLDDTLHGDVVSEVSK